MVNEALGLGSVLIVRVALSLLGELPAEASKHRPPYWAVVADLN